MGNAQGRPRGAEREAEDGPGLSESALIFQANLNRLEAKWATENRDGAADEMYSSPRAPDVAANADGGGESGAQAGHPSLPTSPKDCTVEQLKALKSYLQKGDTLQKNAALRDETLLVTLESLIELSRYRWTELQLLSLSIVKTMIADLTDVGAMQRLGGMAAPVCIHLLGEPESEVTMYGQIKTAAMSVLMNLSRVVIEAGNSWLQDKDARQSMEGIRRVATDRCIQNYITREGIIGLMAAMTAAYLIGTDEDKRYQELLHDAKIPQKLCSALDDTLHGKDVDGAPWKESELVLALLQMSFCEENKQALVKAGAFNSLLMIVQGQRIQRGGDTISDHQYESTVLCYALRTLVELSFSELSL